MTKSKLKLYIVERPNAQPARAVVLAPYRALAIKIAHKAYGSVLGTTATIVDMTTPKAVMPKPGQIDTFNYFNWR